MSLVELLLVISITIIMCSLTIPAYKKLIAAHKEQVLQSQLLRAIQMAREEAITRNVTITLCQSNNNSSCSGTWLQGQILFIDEEGNGKIKKSDNLLTTFPTPVKWGALHWRSFPNITYLQFLPSGFTHAENGTFWYCSAQAKTPSWAIVISKTGRARLVSSALDIKNYAC
jgi:type IV fimbrial biogenesis protein FimT